MIVRLTRRVFLVVASVCLLAAATGAGSCPASPPSGPEEIPGPVALQFPSQVTIDVETTATGDFTALVSRAASPKAFLGSTGEFSDEIALGSDIALHVEGFADGVVSSDGVLGDVVVDIDESIVNFSSLVADDLDLFGGEELKIDFATFASGRTETSNCSGSTAGSQVCYRIWAAETRLIAGYFSTLPTDEHDGAGCFYMNPSDEIFGEDGPPDGLEFSLCWDHTDTTARMTEMALGGPLSATSDVSRGVMLLMQEGEDAESALKTICLRMEFSGFNADEGGDYRYCGRWRENEDIWSGKIIAEMGDFAINNESICARLSTGEEIDSSNCTGDLDPANLTFTDLPEEGEFEFPTDFPEEPTF